MASNRMSNVEIIETQKMLNGLEDKDLYTYAEWKRRGFQVQKGEKAVLKTQIWRRSEKEDKEGNKEVKYFLVNASFFSDEQVKPIEENKQKSA